MLNASYIIYNACIGAFFRSLSVENFVVNFADLLATKDKSDKSCKKNKKNC